jgi:ribosomal protein S18 acetylase RimI-like enzyme
METRLKLILSNPAYKTFVATMDGCVCGMIGTLTSSSYEHDDAGGRILALVTLSGARRRGIGRALIAAAEKDFVQKGIRRVALDTRLTREAAHKFYESLGYERNGWRFVKQLPASN